MEMKVNISLILNVLKEWDWVDDLSNFKRKVIEEVEKMIKILSLWHVALEFGAKG